MPIPDMQPPGAAALPARAGIAPRKDGWWCIAPPGLAAAAPSPPACCGRPEARTGAAIAAVRAALPGAIETPGQKAVIRAGGFG
jgi:hypothetical protein